MMGGMGGGGGGMPGMPPGYAGQGQAGAYGAYNQAYAQQQQYAYAPQNYTGQYGYPQPPYG